MAVRLDPCDPHRLRLLAEDRLPADEVPELEAHLERCDHCRAALDDLAGEPWLDAVRRHLGLDEIGPDDSDPTPFVAVDDVLGALSPSDWPDSLGRLGTYEVKGVIGRGGMGVVFKAFDPALNRNVAIKVLAPHLAGNGAGRRRFLREARAAAAVAHEHIVAVHAVNESAVLPFIVMEYVPGGSLQDRLDRRGPLALAEILRIGMQTAAGLAAAHAQGLVHRDVKPANILLENGIERVKLTDFGLARVAADASMTQSGVVAGTPHYMAPEQALGEPTDHRADLFSLGSTLYVMCTGIPPFRAETPVAVVRRVADDQPRPIRELNPEIPAWLEAIVDRLHAKDPADRFASASELADLLGRCLAYVQEPLTSLMPSDLIPMRPKTGSRGGVLRRRLERMAFLAVPIVLGLAFAYRVWWVPLPIPTTPTEWSAPAGLARTIDVPIVRSARSVPDENDVTFREARDRALAIEADLHRPADPPGEDRFSAMVRDLAERTERLRRQLAPGRDADPEAPNPLLTPRPPMTPKGNVP